MAEESRRRERDGLFSVVLHGSINGHKPKHMKIHLSTRKHFHCNCGHNQGQIAMRGCEAFIREDIQDLSGLGPEQCAQRWPCVSGEVGLDDVCLSGEDRMSLPTSATLIFSEDTNLSLLLVYYLLGIFFQAM